MKKTLLAATAILALSASAYAADLPSRTHAAVAPMATPPVFTWTGFYVGGSLGMLRDTQKVSDPNDWIAYNYKRSSDGGLFGLNAGYNWQRGALVLGLEADIAAATNSTSGNGAHTYSGKLKSLGTVRARVGYALDRALFYVTGGLAYGDVSNTAVGDGDAGAISRTSGWQTGWTLGAGMEYAVAPHWTVRAEALYVDLGKKTGNAGPYCSAVSFKNTDVVARVGVNYKF
jgi:outer membrane immunogenic protein